MVGPTKHKTSKKNKQMSMLSEKITKLTKV